MSRCELVGVPTSSAAAPGRAPRSRALGRAAGTLLAALIGLVAATAAGAAPLDHDCKIADVTVFNDRVHVRCSNAASNGSSNTIVFFAIPTSNAAAADRFLSMAMTAMVSQRTFGIRYDTDPSQTGFGVSTGCVSSDCRVPHRFHIR